MENTIVQLSKYVITFLMICFTVQSFAALKERDEDERHYILMRQIIIPLFECSKRLHGKTDHEEGNHIF